MLWFLESVTAVVRLFASVVCFKTCHVVDFPPKRLALNTYAPVPLEYWSRMCTDNFMVYAVFVTKNLHKAHPACSPARTSHHPQNHTHTAFFGASTHQKFCNIANYHTKAHRTHKETQQYWCKGTHQIYYPQCKGLDFT